MKTHSGRSAAASTQQPMDRFVPHNSRAVSLISVSCPTCHADASAPCLSESGNITNGHRQRRRMAIRAETR